MNTKYKNIITTTTLYALVTGTILSPGIRLPKESNWQVSREDSQTVAERKYNGIIRLVDRNSDGILDNIEYFGRVSGSRDPSETDQRIYNSIIFGER